MAKHILYSVIISSLISCFTCFVSAIHAETDSSKGGKPLILIKTNRGDIKVELDKDKAPISVTNFISYVSDGFYDNTIFHRVIKGFMIQAGGITPDMQQKPTKEQIKNEANNGLKNLRGTIAMGRTSAVDSATSHFFINQADNDFLDHGVRDFGYAVFGNVVEGMDTVDKIANVKTGRGDVPVEPVIIEKISLLN